MRAGTGESHLNSAPQGERPRHPHDIRQRAPRHQLCACTLCRSPLPALLCRVLNTHNQLPASRSQPGTPHHAKKHLNAEPHSI